MQTDTRTNRSFFHSRLAELKAALPGLELAAIASEDGLLAATDAEAAPEAVDRRAAVAASLAAVALTAARELGHNELRSIRIGCGDGALLLRPFGQPRRRLLLLVLSAQADAQAAAQAAHRLAVEIEARLAPAAATAA
jgi:predicted regulator of Ras-like GTPase activity (Roadblock/LC7/MglB family)